ncbi:activating signal cointegrator 1 complex subunit [Phlyctochytrium planicorne]|nr:activating signal cointegrator 1 complex subunit [Phlyctochytrium planicorne]
MNFFATALKKRSETFRASGASTVQDADDRDESVREVLADLPALIQENERRMKAAFEGFEKMIAESIPRKSEDDAITAIADDEMNFALPSYLAEEDISNVIWQDSDSDTIIEEFVTAEIDQAIHSTAGTNEVFDRDWLLSQCEAHVLIHGDESVMSSRDLCAEIFTLLRTNDNEDSLQNALLDALGFGNMDFVSTLISKKDVIVSTIMANADIKASATAVPASVVLGGPKMPNYGTQVTVMTESEKSLMKQYRKENRKRKGKEATDKEQELSQSHALLGLDGDALRRAREDQLLSNSTSNPISGSGIAKPSAPQYPNVYQSATPSVSSYGSQMILPVGTTRDDNKTFEEVSIPFAKAAPPRTNEKPVLISQLPEWTHSAYKNYKSLNRLQSIVYPIAFETNENMLVCAPTGAGKTDVAMLTVLRTLSQFRVNGILQKNDFKIVYVAPMKALAAEIVAKFSARLGVPESQGGLGVSVRELTGDMQLTKAEIVATQMIVTTPEKWDVVTRKSVGDTELSQKVRLLIIDEVHLLHEERGAVIESLVARTLRQVETSQTLIRIVGLSATLPNYVDVAQFLGVNPYQGMFYFDSSFRPVPLEQHFIGIKGRSGNIVSKTNMDRVCYDKVIDLVREGHQVMVFVHSRKDTVKTAMMLRTEAEKENAMGLFDASTDPAYSLAVKEMQKSRNKELKELFGYGFGIHHAGMLRSDRNIVEKYFGKGLMKVLCCTATLAWGVNLPAYAVVIKGTQLYDAQKGTFIDLSILDVLQIFGRAGRPQYEDRGVGYIITSHDKLNHYVSQMTLQHPIESKFANNLTDNLNAEISLGTVTNLEEAIKWLGYTYMFVRMRKNPFHYGLDWKVLEEDPNLGRRCADLLKIAARNLHKAQMVLFDEKTGFLTPKDLGRTASNYYIKTASIEVFNTHMRAKMSEEEVLGMVSMSTEFENIKVREEEIIELKLLEENSCYYNAKANSPPNIGIQGGTDTHYGKTNILLQSYISKANINDFALVSDCAYVAQNAARILRALFDVCLSRNWGPAASVILSLCKSLDRKMWPIEHPLSQFELPYDILDKLERASRQVPINEMREMDIGDVGNLIRHMKMGSTVMKCLEQFPVLILEADIFPITRTVLRVSLNITADFYWNEKVHGMAEPFWIWVEDSENVEILHSEYFMLGKRDVNETQTITFTIPIPRTSTTVDELPPQIFIRAVSDRWIGSETVIPVSFKHLILPSLNRTPHTDLLNLQPLPVSALQNEILEEICRKRFDYFNPVQTQVFHTLYKTHHNALIGAPTGSGKTVTAELALWAAFRDFPQSKVVYIAPLKALVRERVSDWGTRLAPMLGRNLVELTGDVTPDLETIKRADIIITTPEKWDGISRSWQSRSYVTAVSLVIFDEIHLLGGDRGPILEVIVSRMNYISNQTDRKVRIVGLSTALANATDLADWLQIENIGLFNFRHSVRPVPLEIYIDGFPGKHYCPRMLSMNKPAYAAILTHSPTQPVIIFVSSRRQTRLTAQDLIAYCALEDNPKRFLHMPEDDMEHLAGNVKDQSLKLALQFGVGIHHAGLVETDRKLSEELFVNGKIQILIATSTLAWGVNYPAHLVIIKGTEYYDAKSKGYVDMPITDVLQMMGRAGRPQFDSSGVAKIFVLDTKKNFYKKFLHEPFPVESSLHLCIHDHINAEIVGGTIKSKQDAIDYLTWTYLYRRLQMNPTYYGVKDASPEGVSIYLSELIERTFRDLSAASCIEIIGTEVQTTVYGKIASYYYLMYKTVQLFVNRLSSNYNNDPKEGDFPQLLRILTDCPEYAELPVRHNEDKYNIDFERQLPVPVGSGWKRGGFGGLPESVSYLSPHVKAFLLMQGHFSRVKSLPCADYMTDTTSVLDQSIRIMQAMIDVAASRGYLKTSKGVMNLMQCIKQARWPYDSSLKVLPHFTDDVLELWKANGHPENISDVVKLTQDECKKLFSKIALLRESQINESLDIVGRLPKVALKLDLSNSTPVGQGMLEVFCGQKYELKVNVQRQTSKPSDGSRCYCPKFPKPQQESWFAVLGDENADELVAIKRIALQDGKKGRSLDRTLSTTLQFSAPSTPGDYVYTLDLISDAYFGLDVTEHLRLRIVEKM